MRKFVSVAIVFALAVLLVCESTAWAGGGGPKAATYIQVTNNSVEIAAVIVDPPAPFPATPQAFLDAGGKTINPGQTVKFKVAAGNHVVVAALVDAAGVQLGAETTRTYNVGKGKTLRLRVTGSAANDAILTP